MANDVTWSAVALALAGAPIGAAITVLGVTVTNRSNRKSQERQLQAQLDLQRQSLEHDLRSEHQRRVLTERADLYSEIFELCESIDGFIRWVSASTESSRIPEPDEEDFFAQVQQPLRALRGRVAVYCPGSVRFELERLTDSVDAFDQHWNESAALTSATVSMRECAIAAAILDRSSGLEPEGMGGM